MPYKEDDSIIKDDGRIFCTLYILQWVLTCYLIINFLGFNFLTVTLSILLIFIVGYVHERITAKILFALLEWIAKLFKSKR